MSRFGLILNFTVIPVTTVMTDAREKCQERINFKVEMAVAIYICLTRKMMNICVRPHLGRMKDWSGHLKVGNFQIPAIFSGLQSRSLPSTNVQEINE